MEIGFIGLGNMGAPMARNLAAAGHAVTGFDVAGVAVEGVAPAASAAEAAARPRRRRHHAAERRDPARASMPRSSRPARPARVFLDCSTVDVESARAVAAAGRAPPASLAVDAPVSGGTAGAAAGTLTFMAGGTPEAFEQARPLFEVMGSRAVHCGAAGAGQAAKICNNMILGISMIGVCEAFALAAQARPRPARALRRGLDLLGLLLVGDELLPGARRRPDLARPTTTTAPASPPS